MKKQIKIAFLFFFLIIIIFFFNYKKNLKLTDSIETKTEDLTINTNILENVKYESKDSRGNKYTITALKGEIDYANPEIIFLTDVTALINLTNSNYIKITSNFGKYNSYNFDTIFSKDVLVEYVDNKITSEYLDFSIKRETMIISKNVIYSNPENMLKADVIELDIDTKDTKIFMYDKRDKVNIKSLK